jgi:hypothetical protein
MLVNRDLMTLIGNEMSDWHSTGYAARTHHRNLMYVLGRSGLNFYMQDDQNDRKISVLPSASMARLAHFIINQEYFLAVKYLQT